MNQVVFQQYKKELADCKSAIERVNLSEEEGHAVRFAIFSANLTNFLPDIHPDQHADLFKNQLVNLSYEFFDRNVLYASDLAILNNCELLRKPKQPFIFCTFHLGSYRLIANLLARMECSFTTLVRKEIHAQQTQEILEYGERMKATYNLEFDARVANAEDPKILYKLIKELQEGRSLLVYLDGNLGSGDEKLQPVNFLNQTINLRKGIPYISYLTKTPILPVIANREESLQNVLTIGTPIYPEASQSREEYASSSLQEIIDWVSPYIAKYPDQWEAWGYLHNFLTPPEPPTLTISKSIFEKPTYEFNHTRYHLFDLQNSTVLFDKKMYLTYEISSDLHQYFRSNTFINPKNILGNTMFKQLVSQAILI
jgi:lauroyl/myristoyl acyltransferase